jgi:hypothetical protein
MACEYLAKIKYDGELRKGSLSEVHFGKFGAAGVPPLPPTPVKGLPGAGFTKSVRKILRAKGLGVKILKTIGLEHFL